MIVTPGHWLATGDWQLAPGSHAPGPRSHESAGPVSEARPFKAGDRARLPTVGFKISAVQEVPNSARDGVLFSPASHVARVTSHFTPASERGPDNAQSVYRTRRRGGESGLLLR